MGKEKSLKIIKIFLNKLKKDMDVKKVILFGSRAEGTERKDSDIDLIIVSDDFEGMSFFARGSLMYNYWDEEVPVDFLCYTQTEFNTLKKRISIVKEALSKGIILK